MYFFLQDEAEEFTVPSFKAEIVRPFQNYSFFVPNFLSTNNTFKINAFPGGFGWVGPRQGASPYKTHWVGPSPNFPHYTVDNFLVLPLLRIGKG